MPEVIAITCPGGKQCAHLLPLLYKDDRYILRLAAHSKASADRLKAKYPDAEIVSIDLTSLSDCQRLLHGVTAVNAVLPSLHSREKEIGFNLIDAAVTETVRSGNVFKHFVLSSVLCTQHRSLLQHDLKSYVEERLFLSPLNWTILKPTNFMDIYPVRKLASESEPLLTTRWDPSHANSVIALSDFAEATDKVLRERELHFFAEYGLCSTLPISEAEIAGIISKKIGKSVKVEYPGLEASVSQLKDFLFGGSSSDGDERPDLVLDTVERLIMFYNRRGLRGSPNVLKFLLGHEPTKVEEWVERQLSDC